MTKLTLLVWGHTSPFGASHLARGLIAAHPLLLVSKFKNVDEFYLKVAQM